MAPTYDQAKHLVKLAKKNKLIYVVGNMRRHDAGVKTSKKLLKELTKSKELGDFLHYKHYVLAGSNASLSYSI